MTTSTEYELMDTDYITDTIVKRFITASDTRVQSWLDATEDDILEVCKENGVLESTFDTNVTNNGLNYRIKEYMCAYFCYIVCRDVWCTNEVETSDFEIYKIKLEFYSDLMNKLRSLLTASMFSSDEDDLSGIDMVSTGLLFRG